MPTRRRESPINARHQRPSAGACSSNAGEARLTCGTHVCKQLKQLSLGSDQVLHTPLHHRVASWSTFHEVPRRPFDLSSFPLHQIEPRVRSHWSVPHQIAPQSFSAGIFPLLAVIPCSAPTVSPHPSSNVVPPRHLLKLSSNLMAPRVQAHRLQLGRVTADPFRYLRIFLSSLYKQHSSKLRRVFFLGFLVSFSEKQNWESFWNCSSDFIFFLRFFLCSWNIVELQVQVQKSWYETLNFKRLCSFFSFSWLSIV